MCGSWRSSALPVCPGPSSTPAGALPFGGRTPAGPAAAAAATRTAAPDNGTAPPAGYGSLHSKGINCSQSYKDEDTQAGALMKEHSHQNTINLDAKVRLSAAGGGWGV